MKKFALSSLVIITFVIYAVLQKQKPASLAIASSSPWDIVMVVPSALPPVIAEPKPIITPKPKPKPIPAPTPTPAPIPIPVAQGQYKNGSYIGSVVDAYYGNVQVAVSIQNGKIADVQFLDHPAGRSTSIQINNYAMPQLKTEAIQSQSANVHSISGATYTSAAFKKSLASALLKAA